MFVGAKKYWLIVFILILLIGTSYLFYLDLQSSKNLLTFAMFDIGQGDGLYIESPTGTKILVDAGPPRKILGQLPLVMSPINRRIDAIIITNPDQDHIGGFLDVLKNYKVGAVFEPGTFNDSKTYQNLEVEIKKQNIPDVLVKRGMRLDLGGGAVIDILFPDQDVSTWSANDGSVVARLTYGATSVMLTGDATTETEKIILKDNPMSALTSDILKVGHHGSRTSTSENFVKSISPQYALISDGKDNKYGHPSRETLDVLEKMGLKIFRTDLLGTIILKSDGINESFSFHK
ncbi:MAG: MBL fold metallo-hydrolase [Candidatus Pacebacteria bacterium]|nr:MBL fold metallo-hydrolase [Candidatus Paceibacterota bacterium]